MRCLSTVLSIALLAFSQAAHADVVVAQDDVNGFSLSYPDTWHRVSDQLPDDKLTIFAPENGDNAYCRMKVREDSRYAIYPARYSRAVQHTAVSKEFWDEYLSEFYFARPISIRNDAGLGRGFASFAEVSFVGDNWPRMHRRGVMAASLYGNSLYIAECSSSAEAFSAWHETFMGIIKSIDFEKAIFEMPSGHYRDFLGDRTILISNEKAVDLYAY